MRYALHFTSCGLILWGWGMLIVITFYRRRDWGTGSLSPGGILSALTTRFEDFFPVTSIWLQSSGCAFPCCINVDVWVLDKLVFPCTNKCRKIHLLDGY